MKRRTAWLFVVLFSMAVVLPGRVFSSEADVTVGTIDAAGIKKLVAESRSTILVGMASWCFPCRKELPTLIKLHNKYKDKGLAVVGISVDISGPEAIMPNVKEEKVNFPVFWGGEPAIKELEITRLPMLLFLKNGTVVERVVGKEPEDVLDKKVRHLLQ